MNISRMFSGYYKKFFHTAIITILLSSANLLWAIIQEPTALAMRVLENLGVDAIEIKQGILKELETLEELD